MTIQPDRPNTNTSTSDRILVVIGLVLALASVLFFLFASLNQESSDTPPPAIPADVVQHDAGNSDYHLVVASASGALVQFDEHIFYLRAGSPLPDRSSISEFLFHGGKWWLVTSEGDLLEPQRPHPGQNELSGRLGS